MGMSGGGASTDLSGAMSDVMQSGYEAGGILQQANLNSKDELMRTTGYAMETLKDALATSRADTKLADEVSQARNQPYREAGYFALDRVGDSLGLQRPEIGNARMAQAIETGSKYDSAKKALSDQAAEISQYFPTFMGGGGNYAGAPAYSPEQTEMMYALMNQGYQPLQDARYQEAMGYPYPNLAGPYPVPGAAGLDAHGVMPSMPGYPSNPGNTGSGSYGQSDGISSGSGPLGQTGMAGPYSGTGENGMPMGGGTTAGSQAYWNMITDSGKLSTGPGMGFYPTALMPGTDPTQQLTPFQQSIIAGMGFTPSTASSTDFMNSFLKQAPLMTSLGVDMTGSYLNPEDIALLQKYTKESIPLMSEYNQVNQYYTPEMNSLYNAYMTGNFSAPKVI